MPIVGIDSQWAWTSDDVTINVSMSSSDLGDGSSAIATIFDIVA